MKLRLFATAAIAAAAISAPAFAQDAIGSVGIGAAHTEVDVAGFEADGETYTIDGSVAVKATENWTLTVGANIGESEGDLATDDTAFGLKAGATFAGSDWRVGPTVSFDTAGDSTIWTVGGVAQKYIGNVTLAGAVDFGQIDDVDADIWSVGGEVRYFVNDNFRIQGGLTWATVDAGGIDADGWSAGVGGEYQFAGTPWSITGGYTHATVDDADLDSDTFALGVRYSFGGDLKARDRAGADLGAGSSPFASIF